MAVNKRLLVRFSKLLCCLIRFLKADQVSVGSVPLNYNRYDIFWKKAYQTKIKGSMMLKQQRRLQNSVKHLRRSFLRTIFAKLLPKKFYYEVFMRCRRFWKIVFFIWKISMYLLHYLTSVNIVLTFTDKDFLEVDM